MSIAALLGIAASGLAGYQKGKSEAEDREAERQRQEQDARIRDLQAQSAELDLSRKQQDFNDQNLIRSAGMDVVPSTSADGPMPQGQVARVAGQGFGDIGQAQAATVPLNTPEAKTAKLLGVMQQIDPERAAKFESDQIDLRKKRHDFTDNLIKEGAMGFVDQNMARAPSVEDIKANKAGDFDLTGVDDFNKNGDFKIPSGAKGRWKVMTLPNGREVPDFVVNGPDGNQFYPMSARTLQAIHGMTLAEREGRADSEFTQGAEIAHNKGMLGVAQQNANTNEQSRRDQLRLKNQKAASAGIGDGGTQLSLKDIQDFEKEANQRVTEIFQPKEGADQNERAGLGAQRNQLVARASSVFQANATRRNPLTVGQILQALELERDPGNVKVLVGSDGMGYRTVNVNGTPVILSQPLARLQPAQSAAPVRQAPAIQPASQQAPRVASAGLPPTGVDALRSDQVWGPHVVALDQMAAGVVQAKAQLAAAAKSGDPRAVQAYAANLQAARDQLKAQATKRLGNNAQTYLNSLSDL